MTKRGNEKEATQKINEQENAETLESSLDSIDTSVVV